MVIDFDFHVLTGYSNQQLNIQDKAPGGDPGLNGQQTGAIPVQSRLL